MIKYLLCCFHIIIISIFLGCGYKADPVWPGNEKNITEEINSSDLKIIEINNTMEIK
ncbi:conserved hypothetical protein [Lebetimonas natsushimae]|uniref:Lipoprotein n=1 Tax=Lebetimonas natsushimae TaxID=1936991 RepID=A0A292YCZ8_9BACT|nr:conserved hypothetical protein [Lebetimonas natsushimae]